uniref:Uncharacterized protein n=1 Tax=Arundo donax TaxID=35708 RepID=A0A0A9ELN9_ARUDO
MQKLVICTTRGTIFSFQFVLDSSFQLSSLLLLAAVVYC